MNCSQTRNQLPALLYGDLLPEEARRVEDHLASCPACRRECEALRQVGHLLNAAPVPDVPVDLGRLYREAAERHARKLRRWRRAAAAVCAVAAAVTVLVVGSQLEVRLEPQQVVLRWGAAPPLPAPPARPAPTPQEREMVVAPSPSPEIEERLRLLSELVQALAADAELRDDRRQRELSALQAQVRSLQHQLNHMRLATDRDMAALYAALFPENKKGAAQ